MDVETIEDGSNSNCTIVRNGSNSKVWSVTETKHLLEVYEKLMKTKQYKKRKSLWLDVSIHMKSNYINVSSSQCENRWKALKRTCRNSGIRYPLFNRILKLTKLQAKKSKEILETTNKTEFQSSAIKIWNDDALWKFLDIYENQQKDENYKWKKNMWESIAKKMETEGFKVTALNCENKWKTIVRSYRRDVNCPTKIELHARLFRIVGEEGLQRNKPKTTTFKDIDYITLEAENACDETICSELVDEISEIDNNEREIMEIERLEYLEESQQEENSVENEEVINGSSSLTSLEAIGFEILKQIQLTEQANQRRHEENMAISKMNIELLKVLAGAGAKQKSQNVFD